MTRLASHVRPVRAALALLLAAAPLAGCFSERGAPVAPPAGELCDGAQPAGVVRIRDFAFSPASLQVSAGTEVTFVNCDAIAHTSTSDAGAWDSGLLQPRTSFRRVFGEAGSFPYHCEPHPAMKGAVVVQ